MAMRTRNKIQNITREKENRTSKEIFFFLHDKAMIYK